MDNKDDLRDMENINDDKKVKREIKPGLNKEYLFVAIAGIIVGGLIRFLL